MNADDIQPAYLAVHEGADNSFNILWKRPLNRGASVDHILRLPSVCLNESTKTKWVANGYTVENWTVFCQESIFGHQIAVEGLDKSLSDVLVRLERADGRVTVERLTPDRVAFVLEPDPGALSVVVSYFYLGVEHILRGWDHLLFVLCIMILVGRSKKLFWAITAFTLAHSLTLVAATLGYIQFNTRVVEILIALSIVLLAYEITRNEKGVTGLSMRYPWLVIFIFGLLHGMGFAGALNNIGLPHNDVPLALLFFNVGVEIGQVSFILVIMILLIPTERLLSSRSKWTTGTAYCIGSVASFWFFERLLVLG